VGAISDAIVTAAEGLAEAPTLFDLFEGAPLPAGRKNVGYAVEFRAADRTLASEEVDALVRRIAEVLRRTHGAELRAG